ncbi:MAG: hypothetical protein EXR50_08545 [Dehalococcoidia bacterium]|nr:hypothetical protein [Dehalococcoidia bacterium]
MRLCSGGCGRSKQENIEKGSVSLEKRAALPFRLHAGDVRISLAADIVATAQPAAILPIGGGLASSLNS